METIDVKINSNLADLLKELDARTYNAMVRVGREATERAKLLAPTDTGLMKQSIHYKVESDESEDTVRIISPQKYSAYVELGTGVHYPGGRKTPWVYKGADGEWHMTNGQRAKPFLKPAIAENLEEYKAIIIDELQK